MRSKSVFVATCLSFIFVAAEAQNAPSSVSTCSTALASASYVNANALFAGAVSCSQAGRQGDTNFLIILGQIRALADLTIFTPLDDENAKKAAELYGQVYYKFGGLGFDEFYRSPTNVSALEQRIRNTDLRLDKNYDPGWAYRPSSKTDIYSAILSNAREHRIWQMRNFALDIQNDEYYEAYRAEAELHRQNPVFQVGTPAYKEENRLATHMLEIAKRIPQLPEPEDNIPYARLNEQDPEVAKMQVAMGFNGPNSSETYIFRSEAEVRKSWLATALSHQEFEALIAKTDFSKHVLVAFSFGKRMNASGQILLSELGYNKISQGYTIASRIGVLPEPCGVKEAASYPFVVGVTDAVPNADVRGYDTSNFPDKCGPIVSGKPAT